MQDRCRARDAGHAPVRGIRRPRTWPISVIRNEVDKVAADSRFGRFVFPRRGSARLPQPRRLSPAASASRPTIAISTTTANCAAIEDTTAGEMHDIALPRGPAARDCRVGEAGLWWSEDKARQAAEAEGRGLQRIYAHMDKFE